MTQKGVLYICPTPIGNLEDITLRAIRILKEVDVIACEDTRVTQKLLNHYEISTKLISYHKFSEKQKTSYLIELLLEGSNVALVSDAGTPLISDPGSLLMKSAVENKIKVVPLPGACALITALSAIHLNTPEFAFVGFFPRQNKEKTAVLAAYSHTNIVFYESPNRLTDSLEFILNELGDLEASVARELTKYFEEVKHGKLSDLISYYTDNPPKGEIVVVIKTPLADKQEFSNIEIAEKVKKLRKSGYSSKDITKILSTLFDYPKKAIYELTVSD